MPSLANRAFVAALRAHQTIYQASGGWLGHRLLIRPALLLRTTDREIPVVALTPVTASS